MDAQDEFVETQYYKELASIDKQHHAVRDHSVFISSLYITFFLPEPAISN